MVLLFFEHRGRQRGEDRRSRKVAMMPSRPLHSGPGSRSVGQIRVRAGSSWS
jgi:hypothetical protein